MILGMDMTIFFWNDFNFSEIVFVCLQNYLYCNKKCVTIKKLNREVLALCLMMKTFFLKVKQHISVKSF